MTNQERDNFIMEQLNSGVSLSDVQTALAQQYGIRMTYMELRFLADDLKVNWTKQDKPKQPAVPPPPPEAPAPEAPAPEETAEPDLENLEELNDGEEGTTLVTIDDTPEPGSMMSGHVVFASGIQGKWFLDRFGRPGFLNDDENDTKQPTDEDMEQFQVKLEELVQKRQQEMDRKAHDGRTKVEISTITKPGCRLNGTVTFASGASGEWLLGERGIDFDLDNPQQKPTQEDLAIFQILLREQLQSKGFGM
ncbi:MAG: hypothetical protein IJJ26_11300 [Victivallales bacterium]|nr:hypothetical protein [Victivallales bacterium]